MEWERGERLEAGDDTAVPHTVLLAFIDFIFRYSLPQEGKGVHDISQINVVEKLKLVS